MNFSAQSGVALVVSALLSTLLSACASAPTSQAQLAATAELPMQLQAQSPALQNDLSRQQGMAKQQDDPAQLTDLAKQARLPWLAELGSPEIEALLRLALKQNWDLQVLSNKLAIAQSRLQSVRAESQWQTDAVINLGRNDPLSGSQASTKTQSLSLSSRWEIDLWQKLSSTEQASELSLMALESEQTWAQISLAGTLSKAWLQANALTEQLNLVAQELVTWQTSLRLLQRRYQAGEARRSEVAQTQSQLNQSKAKQAELSLALANAKLVMFELIGEPAKQASLSQISDVQLPQKPQLTDVSQIKSLLLHRPDVAAASLNLRAADASAYAAYRALWPSLSLKMDLQKSAGNFSKVAASPLALISEIQLLQPLLNRQALKTEKVVAEQQAQIAKLEYLKTLTSASSELELLLLFDQALTQQADSLQQALSEAQRASNAAKADYLSGIGNAQDWLALQRQSLALAQQKVQIKQQVLANWVALQVATARPAIDANQQNGFSIAGIFEEY